MKDSKGIKDKTGEVNVTEGYTANDEIPRSLLNGRYNNVR
jgi:hypothetical protein